MGAEMPKQLMPYEGSTVLGAAVRRFACSGLVDGVAVVSPEDGSLDAAYREVISGIENANCRIGIVRGGAERSDSVKAGLAYAAQDSAAAGFAPEDVLVLIHDAARPGVTEEIIRANIEAMDTCRAVVTAVKSVDSIRMILSENTTDKSVLLLKESISYPIMYSTVVDRDLVYNVQTPQTFRLADIDAAYARADADGYRGTDDASIAEHAGISVAIVPGSASNSKITYREDISMTTRVGTGYDVHRLVPGRDLILCGTPVPYEKGLLGHSDADVATHALMDALLGAAGLGDIGRHFPDSDDRYKGADSLKLLAEVKEMLGDVTVNNVDITIIAQAPKLAPYNKQMQTNISKTLGIPESAVNIKATTEEGLGFTGRGEGIAAIATCAIEGRFI
jgi:2-C-methyl-D-erythritol 4-phosphate cytidylyltransferase/2-C-methyl-D-erythritol 2,4-cyclodiphosphate synthase